MSTCYSECHSDCGCYDCPGKTSVPALADYICYDQKNPKHLDPATVEFTLKNCYSLDPVIDFVNKCPIFVGQGREEMIALLEDLNEMADSLYLYHSDILDIDHMGRNILRIHIVRPTKTFRGCEDSTNPSRRNSDDQDDQDDKHDQDDCERCDDQEDRDGCENRDSCKDRKESRRSSDSDVEKPAPSSNLDRQDETECKDEKECKDEEMSEERCEDGDDKLLHRITLDLEDYRRCCQQRSANSNCISSEARCAFTMVSVFMAALIIPTLTLVLR